MSPRFSEALQCAELAHRSQTRKETDIPYMGNLLIVAGLVIEAGGDEDVAIAALIHHAVEDQGGAPRLADIGQRFGDRVADIVDACTDSCEEPKPAWRTRKEAYIASVAAKSDAACMVTMADKLHNTRAILRDFEAIGDALWARFSASKDETLWYYRSLTDASGRRSHSTLCAS